jgi:formylglycine-generating enzyme required for sulfatase activity
MTEVTSTDRLKVFVSYSRRDSADFAEELVAGLELAGFAPFLDRHDIAAGEEWEARLGSLIRQADTVVYVISPEAVKSPRCEWEVDKALGEAKRVLPIIFKAVSEEDIPRELERRQFIRFDTGPGITRPLGQLAEALRQDIEWIREHTRLGESATRWEVRGRPQSMLLRGDDVAAAQLWIEKRKSDAPAITELMRVYIEASKQNESSYLAKSKLEKRRARWARTFAALCILVAAATLASWWEHDWLKERVYVLTNVTALTTTQERALKPKDPFKECTDCPDMIVVPAGSFMMGSPTTEKGRSNDEGPLHNVTIAKPFAVAKYEVTFAEWDACVAHGDCDSHIGDRGWGRGRQPAINVSRDDARSYVAWLSRITGKEYRLLSEAEYEYAARAGTQTVYPWGDDIGKNNANCTGCGSQWDRKQTAPVGSFAANAFGLYDMVGNVEEWTEDCFYVSYNGAPADGAAWTSSGCVPLSGVIRGGSWVDDPAGPRSAHRDWAHTDSGAQIIGFRVGRTLSARTGAIMVAPEAR